MGLNPLSYFTTINKNAELIKQATKELYRKNLELLRERKRLDEILNNITDGVIAFNRMGKITIFNTRAEQLLGWKSEGVLGLDIGKVAPFYLNGQIVDMAKEVFKSPMPSFINTDNLDYKLNVVSKAGKEIFITLSVNIVDEDVLGKEVILSFYDLSEFKKLSDLKTDIISIASHELRTPMTVVKNYLWMLANKRGDEKLTKDQSGYVSKAIQNSDRMLSLINDMLNVSRIEQGKLNFVLEQFVVQDLVLIVKDDMKARKGDKKIKLIFNVPKAPIKMLSDKVKFLELITNLFTNSIKYTNEGEIELNIIKKEKSIFVQIRDTGVGIPLSKQKQLFEKFGRLNSSFVDSAQAGGTGLGLYISKQYVDGLDGTIGVISEGEQKGSIFWFQLPLRSTIKKNDKV